MGRHMMSRPEGYYPAGMYLGCIRDVLGMYLGCTRDVLGMYLRCTWDVFGMYLKSAEQASGILPCRDVIGM